MATAVIEPEVSTLEPVKQEALTLAHKAEALKVTDNASFLEAGSMLKAVVDRLKQWKELVAPAKESAHDAHKRICAMEKTVADPLTAVETHLRRQISTYTTEQERIRKVEEARLQEESRKQAEEAARIAAESAQIDAAVAAEQLGDVKSANQIISAPVQVAPVMAPPVVLQSTVPKAAGVSTRAVWKFRVTDANKIPREFLIVDEVKLRKFAGAMQHQAKVEGVEFYSEETVVVR